MLCVCGNRMCMYKPSEGMNEYDKFVCFFVTINLLLEFSS